MEEQDDDWALMSRFESLVAQWRAAGLHLTDAPPWEIVAHVLWPQMPPAEEASVAEDALDRRSRVLDLMKSMDRWGPCRSFVRGVDAVGASRLAEPARAWSDAGYSLSDVAAIHVAAMTYVAPIEWASTCLSVERIIACIHAGCRAAGGRLRPDGLDGEPDDPARPALPGRVT